ncbi:putative spermidine/putrescine transport system permease protein [Variovorax boronicumulans]|uniref:ABC transporter permease n=1 Tax=Variovorax boronicumulans TaxID=436515 RepID=UPI002476FD2F|nr:ABC transporter permease [Variovorax boronicumulans]MDH6169458.1 putative spermidine/putrescine transport system permease protein [Variovorax boronicumulans]
MTADGATCPTASRGLKSDLRRASRRHRTKALLLIAPLALFLLLTFLVPIGALLSRSVVDTEVAEILPTVSARLQSWNGSALPDDAVFAALATDVRAARSAGRLASAATRLNYDVNGFRSLMFSTARRLPDGPLEPSAREVLVGIDPKWGELDTWGALARAKGPATSLFVLGALDLRSSPGGGVEAMPSDQAVFVPILWRTLSIAGGVTLACLLLGYPLAYLLASLPERKANLLMICVLLPFWVSLLVRTTAWVVLLQNEGVVNTALLQFHLINEPLAMLYTRFAVYAAMVHVLLPFVVLPLYAVMKSIPPSHMRAAGSLGATPWTAFRRVYLPQTLPGVGAGGLMVFIQALGYYITPALVGGAGDQMISYFIAFYATKTINWGMAAALSLLLLMATTVLYTAYARLVGVDRMKAA